MDDSQPEHCIAVLLAGGRSQRMGRDKSLLPWRGRPLWQHMRDLCLAAGCARVLISGDPALIPGAIADRDPGLGPLGGVASTLATLDGEYRATPTARRRILLLPVDLPLLTTQTLQGLLQAGNDARAAHFSGHPLPVLLQDSAALRTALASTLAAPHTRDRSLQALQRVLAARELALPADLARTLVNTNTPEDWLAAGGQLP